MCKKKKQTKKGGGAMCKKREIGKNGGCARYKKNKALFHSGEGQNGFRVGVASPPPPLARLPHPPLSIELHFSCTQIPHPPFFPIPHSLHTDSTPSLFPLLFFLAHRFHPLPFFPFFYLPFTPPHHQSPKRVFFPLLLVVLLRLFLGCARFARVFFHILKILSSTVFFLKIFFWAPVSALRSRSFGGKQLESVPPKRNSTQVGAQGVAFATFFF